MKKNSVLLGLIFLVSTLYSETAVVPKKNKKEIFKSVLAITGAIIGGGGITFFAWYNLIYIPSKDAKAKGKLKDVPVKQELDTPPIIQKQQLTEEEQREIGKNVPSLVKRAYFFWDIETDTKDIVKRISVATVLNQLKEKRDTLSDKFIDDSFDKVNKEYSVIAQKNLASLNELMQELSTKYKVSFNEKERYHIPQL